MIVDELLESERKHDAANVRTLGFFFGTCRLAPPLIPRLVEAESDGPWSLAGLYPCLLSSVEKKKTYVKERRVSRE